MKLTRVSIGLLISYLAALTFVLFASLFPEARLWGGHAWGLLPSGGVVILVTLWLVSLIPAWGLGQATEVEPPQSRYWLMSGLVLVLFVIAIYLFRFRTYFLGDGYTLISLLAADTPLIKWRNYGGTVVQKLLLPFFSGSPQTKAVMVYQLVSWVAGGLFVGLSAVGAYFLRRKLFDRVVLLLGLCTGGYALLFFGYVENYALWMVAVTGYCLVGIGVVQGRVRVWWLVAMQAVVVFFHIFGLVFLPVTVFLALRSTPVYRWVVRQATPRLLVGGAVIAMLGAVGLLWLRAGSLNLRVAILPLVEDRFTIDEYTLFSPSHLLDIINLLFVLCPGAIVAGWCWWQGRRAGAPTRPELWFLGTVTILCGGLLFFIDPKLGMARDWDLFAFAGVPLVLWCYLAVLPNGGDGNRKIAAVLMVAMGLIVLAGRVAVGVVPDAGVRQSRDYMYLDPVRSHNCWSILVDYHTARGDSASAIQATRDKFALVPEELALIQARQAMVAGDAQGALAMLSSAQARYRGIGAYHSQVGAILLKLNRVEESFRELSIARAMNPYDPNNLTNLGSIYYLRGDTVRAKAHWMKALAVHPQSTVAINGLTAAAAYRGDMAEVARLYEQGAGIEGMQLDFYQMVAESAILRGEFDLAARALERGLERGLDTSYVETLRRNFPGLRPH